MQSAWARRRASLDAPPDEARAALTRAREELSEAVRILGEGGGPVSYAHAVHLLANVELDSGDEAQALSLWEEAVQVLRAADDALQLAHKVRHLGDLHRHCGRLEEADGHYSEALSLYRRHDRPGSLDFANAVSRVAALKDQLGERELAFQLWCEARDLYAAVGIAPGVEEAEAHMRRLKGQSDPGFQGQSGNVSGRQGLS